MYIACDNIHHEWTTRQVQVGRNVNITNMCHVTAIGRVTAVVVSINVLPWSKHDQKHCKWTIVLVTYVCRTVKNWKVNIENVEKLSFIAIM